MASNDQLAPLGGKVLVVDDDDDIREVVTSLLEDDGYELREAADGATALRTLFSWRPDLVILDIGMPEMNGWQVLQRIRDMTETPVIMLTAFADPTEKVRALRAGADDYVTKPFASQELSARVGAVLRRVGTSSEVESVYDDEALHLDFQRHQVWVRGQEVDLSPLQFRMLSILVRNADFVLSAERLLDLCWEDRPVSPANVRICIRGLRRILEENPSKPRLIETVREFGYRYRIQRARR